MVGVVQISGQYSYEYGLDCRSGVKSSDELA